MCVLKAALQCHTPDDRPLFSTCHWYLEQYNIEHSTLGRPCSDQPLFCRNCGSLQVSDALREQQRSSLQCSTRADPDTSGSCCYQSSLSGAQASRLGIDRQHLLQGS